MATLMFVNFKFAGQAVLNTAFSFKFCRSEINVQRARTSVGLDAVLQHFFTDNILSAVPLHVMIVNSTWWRRGPV